MNKKNKIMNASLLSIVLVLTSLANIAYAHSSSDINDAADFVLTQLSIKDEVLVYVWGPVNKGVSIYSTKEHILDTPENGYVIYIDPYPQANLFHPVKYVFLGESTQKLIVKDVMSPPLNFNDYQLIKTDFSNYFMSIKNRRPSYTVQPNSPTMQPTADSRIAVLMNGGYNAGNNHVRYWNDLSNIYIALNHVYNIPDENIIVLCSDGLDPSPDQSNGQNSDPDLDGDGDDDIMYACLLSNIDQVFADLATNLTMKNELFVFQTDHGSSKGGWDTVFNLWNMEELTDAHFAQLLENISVSEIVCTFEPCFSGGFLDDVVVPPGPVVASSACRHDEYSWAMNNLEYDEYVFHWTAAVMGEDAYGEPVDADYNGDGEITMDEAFEYAETHDVQPESPQYGDYPENCGENITLHIGNMPPNDPGRPSGPNEGVSNVKYTFTTNTSDPEGEQIFYMFNWGDGTYSEWLGPYESGDFVMKSHAWNDSGDFNITVKARDINERESDWSEPHSIHILKGPFMNIGQVLGGIFKIKAIITNIGELEATNISWSMTVDGGFILLGKQTTGTIPSIPPGGNVTVNSKLILGFGDIKVTTIAEIEENIDEKTNNGFAYLLYIQINPSG
jgi:hypothetical protein